MDGIGQAKGSTALKCICPLKIWQL